MNTSPQLLHAITGDPSNPLKEPTFAVADENGNVFVADSGNHLVKVFDPKGKFLFQFGGQESKKPLLYPYGIGVLNKERIIVADTGAGALYEYNAQGEQVRAWLEPGAGSQPAGVFVAPDKTVYVTDLAGKKVLVFSEPGQLLRKIEPQNVSLGSPLGIEVNLDGTVWVADGGNYNIKLMGKDALVKAVFDGGPKNPLSMAKGLAVDKQGRIYVADTMSNAVRVFDGQGNDLFTLGRDKENTFRLPNGLSIDKTGKIYIADQGNNKIQVWGWK